MKLTYFDKAYNFIEIFDTETGFHYTSGILTENGKDSGVDPLMRSFPALMDIGIMGGCSSAGVCKVGCYQQGKNTPKGHMSVDFFRKLMDEASGKTFSVALGGFGNPNEHPNFLEIIRYARMKSIAPSYTTAGTNLTDNQVQITRRYCGAVAVSEHFQPYTLSAIQRFVDAGCITNIHYVVANDTIDEAIRRLEENDFPKGIYAVIFLLYKPVGKGKVENCLKVMDPRIRRFYELIEAEHPFKCGLDSCHIPGVMNFTKNVLPESIVPCDAARFSMYVTPDGFALPCSFDTNNRKYAVDIKEIGIQGAWESEAFERFRNHYKTRCSHCEIGKRINCLGGCGLMAEQINLCPDYSKGE